MDTSRTLLIILLVIALFFTLLWLLFLDPEDPPEYVGESTIPEVSTTSEVTGITWDEHTIRDQEGTTHVEAARLPNEMPVDEGIQFGASGPIRSVALSPDKTWIAFATAGAAHGGGWLYNIESEETHAVAFQYGGGMQVIEWSPDGTFIAFAVSSPAEIDQITIVDRRAIAPTVAATGFTLLHESQEGMDPPYRYEFEGWHEPHLICATFEGERFCVDASTREMIAEE